MPRTILKLYGLLSVNECIPAAKPLVVALSIKVHYQFNPIRHMLLILNSHVLTNILKLLVFWLNKRSVGVSLTVKIYLM